MPGGRPTKLDQIVGHRPDGAEVTVADRILDRIRLGMTRGRAATAGGIDRLTLHRWILEGARLRALQAQGKLKRPGKHQTRLIEFCNAIDQAEEDAVAAMLGLVQVSARGGATKTKQVTRTDNDGAVTTTTTTETMAGDVRAAIWWLEHVPADFRYATRVELTGADGAALVPEVDAARNLADSLRAYLDGRADAQAEATAEATA